MKLSQSELSSLKASHAAQCEMFLRHDKSIIASSYEIVEVEKTPHFLVVLRKYSETRRRLKRVVSYYEVGGLTLKHEEMGGLVYGITDLDEAKTMYADCLKFYVEVLEPLRYPKEP